MSCVGDSRIEGCSTDGVGDDVSESVGAMFDNKACSFFDAARQAMAER